MLHFPIKFEILSGFLEIYEQFVSYYNYILPYVTNITFNIMLNVKIKYYYAPIICLLNINRKNYIPS